MTCAEIQDQLSAWVDEDLSPSEQILIQQHLEECAVCNSLAQDLTAIKNTAQNLLVEVNSSDGWSSLERALKKRQGSPWSLSQTSSQSKSWSTHRWPWLIAAAAGLIVVVSLSLFRWENYSTEKQAERELTLLINQQQRALKALSLVVQSKQSQWDGKLQETFARNAALVDAAIVECRQAVQSRPADLALRASLMEAYQRKVEFLKVFSGLAEEAP